MAKCHRRHPATSASNASSAGEAKTRTTEAKENAGEAPARTTEGRKEGASPLIAVWPADRHSRPDQAQIPIFDADRHQPTAPEPF